MILPNPHATYMQNLVATALLNKNTSASLKLEIIATRNGWELNDLRAEFERQEKAWLSKDTNAATLGGDGK